MITAICVLVGAVILTGVVWCMIELARMSRRPRCAICGGRILMEYVAGGLKNGFLEQVASVAKGFSLSHLTLELASGQIVIGMNARDPFSAINVRITPGLA